VAVLSPRLSERLTGVAYQLGWKVICRFPESWARWAFMTAADLAWRRQGPKVQVLEANLRRVLTYQDSSPDVDGKELRTLSRSALRSYARYWLEVFRLPAIGVERLVSGMHFRGSGEEALFASLKSGRGVLIALPHMGNFEQAGAWVIARGTGPLTTVAERLKPESVYESFVRFRQTLGFEVLPLTGGSAPFGTLAQRLRAGHLVCLVSDRDLKESGIEVELLGADRRERRARRAHRGGAAADRDLVRRGRLGCLHLRRGAGAGHRNPRGEDRGDEPAAGRRVFRGDRRAPARLAHAATGLHRRSGSRPGGQNMRIGIACPYSWDVPGGVQQHIRDLAEELIYEGHEVSVISPADDDTPLPPYVVGAGRAVPVPYNGSVARLSFGFLSVNRVRRWLKEGGFDVLHVHEPEIPSLSLLACWVASGPIVATVHTSIPRSRILLVTYPVVRTGLEKINGRIAVSEAARTTLVEHIGGDAVVIPNGVATRRYRKADPLPGWPGTGGAIGFLGRLDEPRKGLSVLLKAFEILGPQRPGLRLLVAGPAGDADEVLHKVPAELRDRVVLLGQVSEEDKVRVLHSVDVFCSPNTGGESFGIVTAEAMAAGVPIVASDIDAFRQVLRGGEAGELFTAGDAADLARAAGGLLDNRARRAELSAAALAAVAEYDWSVVARAVLSVYETVVLGSTQVKVAAAGGDFP
jgi:phosphatidylinositol alpha-mannosyltransferase